MNVTIVDGFMVDMNVSITNKHNWGTSLYMQKKPAHTTERCSPLRLVSIVFDEKKPGNEMMIPND